MEKKLLLRGALSGAVAGLIAFVFARIFAEPQIQKAIDYEAGRDAAQDKLNVAAHVHSEEAGHELFSRSVQGNLGLGLGLIVFGLAMGALVAVVYTVCLGRVGNIQPRTLALLVALGGFLGFFLVPFIKYPANPPAVGHGETIKERGTLYLGMVLASILLLVAAVWLGQRLAARFGNWNAALLAGLAFIVAIGIVMLALPSLGHLAYNKEHFGNFATETPQPLTDDKGTIVYPGFPADVLASFRLYSVGAQALMWGILGLIFAPLAERVLAPAMTRRADEPVAVS